MGAADPSHSPSAKASAPRGTLLLALGLGTALVAALGRAGVLYAMDVHAHAEDLGRVQFRLAQAAPGIALQASLTALVAAALAVAVARIPAVGTRRLVAAALTLALGAWLTLWISGQAGGDPSRQVGLMTDRGRKTMAVLGAASFLLAAGQILAILLVHGRMARARGAAGVQGLRMLGVLALAALVVLPIAARVTWGSVSERMVVRDVVRDLLSGEPTWEVVHAREDGAPGVEVLSPAIHYSLDGADLVSLSIPPPGEVRFTIAPEDGPALLRMRTGVDLRAMHPNRVGDVASFHFEVLVNGATAFTSRVAVPEGEKRETEWSVAPSLEVADGDVVTLRTSARNADGDEIVPVRALPMGFGQLLLERELRVRRSPSSPEAPNIVLIVMDTQRADRLSVYGYGRETSPNLERLAARGLVHEQAYATSSWTWPSTASLLTGLLPQQHGVLDGNACFLAEELQTLPETLQRAGLTTAGWSANLLIVPDKNFDQGFEFFDAPRGSITRSDVMIPPALEWMEAYAGTRFFMYLQMLDPHSPLDPMDEARERFAPTVPEGYDEFALEGYRMPFLRDNCGHTEDGERVTERCVPPEEQRWISDLYDACVWSGDHWVGRILDKLEELGLDDETIVIFTSDHGEEIFDHGLVAHGHTLHEELVRVPLILAGPGIPAGVRTDAPASNRFLASTIARLAGTEMPSVGRGPDLARPGAGGPGDVIYMTRNGWWNGRWNQKLLGMRREDRVLHFAPQGSPWGAEVGEEGHWALYDVADDPRETVDLAPREPDLARSLRDELERRTAELEALRAAPDVGAGAATMQRLRDIGYVGEDE